MFDNKTKHVAIVIFANSSFFYAWLHVLTVFPFLFHLRLMLVHPAQGKPKRQTKQISHAKQIEINIIVLMNVYME